VVVNSFHATKFRIWGKKSTELVGRPARADIHRFDIRFPAQLSPHLGLLNVRPFREPDLYACFNGRDNFSSPPGPL